MSQFSNEVINKLSSYQNQIWQTVSLTASETCGQALSFSSPLTVSTRTEDIYAELGSPMMVIQFSFAGLPENPQLVLIPQDTAIELASFIKQENVTEIDENVMSDVRSTLESFVQGICLSIGNIKNDPLAASGLSIRFQILSIPPNIQNSLEIARIQLAITGEGLSGTCMWLMDAETAYHVCGMAMTDSDESMFPQVDAARDGAARPVTHTDPNSLDMLMDIPLEISVELGRVKMLVKDVVELGTGSIVEIEKAAGEPVDVLVNGRLVARGEVVVIEDNFGVRITEIVSPQERLARLGEAA